MTKLLLLAGCLAGLSFSIVSSAPAQTAAPAVLTVKAARALGAGSTVMVRAVVLNGAEMGNIRYIQDAEAGLALYAQPTKLPGYGELRAGDSIQVTGQLKAYNGLLEMDPITSLQKLAAGRSLHAVQVPVEQATAAFAEANESRLLEIKGVSRLANMAGTPATRLAANANYLLDGQPDALLRVGSASTGPNGLVDTALPTGETFDVRGVMSQFAPGGTGGYQLLPRLATDVVLGGGLPRLTNEPVPADITPTGFTIAYSTLNPGDTRIRYGLNPKELKESKTDAALTTRHSLTLTGLLPGTTYYVKVSSRNAVGTETAPLVPVSTSSGNRGRTTSKN
ncbi:fibronectin type III domain-containing protein [Hymenobacter sp. B1770]|uniref:fibronectin type III domain-containing protein n=1 Tax=Hymenobacter sp. B1770 TaxID=1718788 RepID=UPI003CE7D7B8